MRKLEGDVLETGCGVTEDVMGAFRAEPDRPFERMNL